MHAENNCWTETYGHYSKALGQTDLEHSLVTTAQSWCHLDTSILTRGRSRCHPLPPCGHRQAQLSQAVPFSDDSVTALPLPREHRHTRRQSRNRTKPTPPSRQTPPPERSPQFGSGAVNTSGSKRQEQQVWQCCNYNPPNFTHFTILQPPGWAPARHRMAQTAENLFLTMILSGRLI